MHVLITRPEADAAVWQSRLVARGIAVTVDPLLTITPTAPQTLDIAGVQALVLTSRNALTALGGSPALSAVRHLPVFTVGPGTTEAARTMGFARVHPGPATARDLIPVITTVAAPTAGRLLHLSGDRIAVDLAAELTPYGFDVERLVVYRSTPADRLAPATLARLRSREIDTVALLSPLSAETFLRLLMDAQILDAHQRLVYVCLSGAIARRVNAFGRGADGALAVGTTAGGDARGSAAVHVAEAPNAEAVLALIERLA